MTFFLLAALALTPHADAASRSSSRDGTSSAHRDSGKGSGKGDNKGGKKGNKKKKETRLAVAAAKRPLTIGDNNVSVGLAPAYGHYGPSSGAFGLAVPVRGGLNNDLDLHLTPSLTFAGPSVAFSDIGATWRFYDKGDAEVGLRVTADVMPTSAGTYASISPGLPVRVHVSDAVAVDTGLYAGISLNKGGGTAVAVPLTVTGNINKRLFLQGSTGLGLGIASGTTAVGIPLGGAIGYTLPKDGRPQIDFTGQFGFVDVRTTSVWVLGGTATFYFYL